MTAREIAHILTITPDPENDEDWDWEITCPYEPEQPGYDDRTCSMVTECDCKLSHEEREALFETDEAPCPTSPTGMHRHITEGVGHDISGCWARHCDDTHDRVGDVRHDHGAGTFLVAVAGCWETAELIVLAHVDEAVAA